MYKIYITRNYAIKIAVSAKLIFVMKITILLLFIGLIHVNASTIGQTLTIKKERMNYRQFFREITKQTGYDVLIHSTDFNLNKKIVLDFQQTPLLEALSWIKKNERVGFVIQGKSVIFHVEEGPNPENIGVSPNENSYQEILRGRVLDKENRPLQGVSVKVRNNPRIATMTNERGEFRLPLSANGQEVVFSIIGYKTFTQILNTQNDPHVIKLEVDVKGLDEIVVNTGVFQKDSRSFTGASTTVTREQLLAFGDKNLVTSLRNIDPSFNIIESNAFGSNPNRMPEVQIRGNSNIPNVNDIQSDAGVALNTPLIILDNFQTSLQKLMDINENDVESITILKDASATALYGSRGANGVIVITTRAPQAGKLRFSVGSQFNVEDPELSDYSQIQGRDKLELERLAGYYNDNYPYRDVQLKQYYNFILGEINRGVETNWLNIPLRTSVGNRQNLRLEGGDQKFRYAASVQNNNIQGVMKGSSRNTFNGGITLAYTFENLKFRNNLQIQQGKSNESPYGSFSEYAALNSYWAPYDENGNVNKILGDPGNSSYFLYWQNGLPTNPLFNATLKTYDKTQLSEILNNTSVDWNITADLILRGQLGLTKSNTQSDRFRPAEHTAFNNYSVDDFLRKGDYRFGQTNYMGYDGSVDLIYSNTFKEKHLLFSAVNFNVRQAQNIFNQYLVEGFSNANLDFPSMALQYEAGGKPSGTESFTRALGFTGNVNYSYDNRFFADATLRYDGASQFGSQNRFAQFWSTGLGWNLHNEAFIRDIDFINRLKLRGSIGTTGNQNFNAYQSLTTYRYFTDDRYYSWIGAYPFAMGNNELKWQTSIKKNIGADMEFFNRRLQLRADVYVETTKDLVSSVNLPASNGFDYYTANIGKLENRGFEINLTGFVFNNPQGFTWNISTAILRNKNKVIETSEALKNAQKVIQSGVLNPGTMYVEGYSSRTIWVVPSLGIDPSTGKEVFLKKNGEATFTWNADDVAASGNAEPTYFGNINSTLRYKNLALNFSFRYEFGGQLYNSTLRDKVETNSYKYSVDSRVYDDRWKAPGDQVAFKSIFSTSQTNKTSRFVQDNNTLILSNVNFQYQIHRENWFKKLGMESLILTANASDPLHLSSIRQERGTVYPFAKRYSIGLNATF